MNARIRLCILGLLFLLLTSGATHSQWRPIGPAGNYISSIVYLDSVIIASSLYEHYLERSIDGGKSWSQIQFPDSIYVGKFATTSSQIFMTVSRGLMASRDRGASWQSVKSFPTNVSTSAIVSIPGAILTVSYGNGIYRSTDEGATWTKLPVNDSLKYNSSIYSVGTGPLGNLKYTIFVVSNYGVFRSTDIGFTWSKVDVGTAGIQNFQILANVDRLRNLLGTLTISTTLYAKGNNGVYASSDLGTSWKTTGNSLSEDAVFTICPVGATNDTLLAGTQFGVMMLASGDSVWRYSAKGMPQAWVGDMRKKGSTLIAGTSLGMFFSTDNGATWTLSAKGMKPGMIYCVAATPSALFASKDQQIFRRKHGTSAWEIAALPGHRTGSINQIISAGSSRMFAVSMGNGFIRSLDNGDTWTDEGNAMGVRWNSMVYSNTLSRLYAGTDSGAFVSTNFGTSWSSAGPGFPGQEILLVSTHTQGAVTTVFVASRFIGLNYSENNGATWIQRTVPYRADLDYGGGAWPQAMAFGGGSWFVANGISRSGLFRSSDFGVHWDTLFVPGDNANDIVYTNNTLIIASKAGLILTKDLGKHWIKPDSSQAPIDIRGLALLGDTLYAATSQGVLMRRVSELATSVGSSDASVPLSTALYANYPNPFNPSTTIRYEIARAGSVRLVVYDILGREAAVLVNEVKPAGRYEAAFDAARLASGVYVYRLETGGTSLQRRMMFIK